MTVTLPLYRPSNATEGEAFAATWCASCEARPACDLPARTLRHKPGDALCPTLWVRGPSGPRCLSYYPKESRDDAL